MEHALINTIIASLVVAFLFGLIAKKLKLPEILGYLLAGVVIGPHTPGFVADVGLAKQLAEIGIALLMFGVGLHFSFRDLFDFRKIALPSAIMQMSFSTILGASFALFLNYPVIDSICFGMCLCVSSTIVMLRSLEQRNLLSTDIGKLAVGWLVIEDLIMVIILVLLPVFADISKQQQAVDPIVVAIAFFDIILKLCGFFAFIYIVGRKLLPWILNIISHTKSSELNIIGILAISLGLASLGNVAFGASLALGAFLAGMVLNESEIGRKSAVASLSIRDAFSVLFFVSVGMLFDPKFLVEHPVKILCVYGLILVGNGFMAMIILFLFKQKPEISKNIGVGLAQIGEF